VSDIIGKRLKFGNTRKDFMQLLIQLKEKGRLHEVDEDELENNESVSNFG